MGATIGSVIPTKGAIIPAAVGVDIGCGMIATRLDLTVNQLPDDLRGLHTRISQAVPSGVGKGHDSFEHAMDGFPSPARRPWADTKLEATARDQFGSLGSGNHFVEVCLDELDRVWLVLHSGSRGIGNKLATQHIDGAKKLMQRYFIGLPDPDLAYLVEGTPEFREYISDMTWAQEYAMGNRQAMMAATVAAVEAELNRPVVIADSINCHHNFTQQERHDGGNVWITRKGAIKANIGDRGVIPGSMGTRSYIVSGLGNRASYHSCSHGAGRRLGRKEARRQLTVESFNEAMTGIAWNGGPSNRQGNDEQLLDEHPAAYKDIDTVMANQADLATIDHTLHQVLNYKGT
jgi:tRNA-splicing ligase RtcB